MRVSPTLTLANPDPGPGPIQAAPHPDPPYLGRCSLAFLRPPDMDFVLRPMHGFDVMEVPLLHRQLHATFQAALCAPLLWPQQAHYSLRTTYYVLRTTYYVLLTPDS